MKLLHECRFSFELAFYIANICYLSGFFIIRIRRDNQTEKFCQI